MNFTCAIFHLLFKVIQVLSHGTHLSGHNLYAFGIILGCLVQYTNVPTFLSYYPKEETDINVPFWRTAAKFSNVEPQPIIFIKTFNDLIFIFLKGCHWNSCVWSNEDNFLMEGMMVWIILIIRRFITNNTKKCFMKYHNRSRNNTLQIRVVHDTCFCGQTENWKETSSYQVMIVYRQGLEEQPHTYNLKPLGTSGKEYFHITLH